MTHLLTANEVLRQLRQKVEAAGGQSEWARIAKIDRTHLNAILKGKRLIVGKIAHALKLQPIAHYVSDNRALPVYQLDDVLQLLREEVESAGGQSDWAHKASCSRTLLSKVINGTRVPGKTVLRPLGLRKIYLYRSWNTSERTWVSHKPWA
jgi:DNA-binding phage protein